MSDQRREARPAEAPYHALCLCLTCRDRAVLYSRIDRRVDEMVENGVLDEARQVYDHRDAYRTAAQAIGYKEFFPYFEHGQSDRMHRASQAGNAQLRQAPADLVPPSERRGVALSG